MAKCDLARWFLYKWAEVLVTIFMFWFSITYLHVILFMWIHLSTYVDLFEQDFYMASYVRVITSLKSNV